MAKVAIEHQ